MAFCSNCGQPLAAGAKFCASCGTPAGGAANDGSKRVQKFDGEIHKCPNCGAQLPSMAVRCPECGFELRGVRNTSAAVELQKLIDSVKPVYDEDGDLNERKTNEKKVALMKNFVIPNTAEDINELMIMASSYVKTTEDYYEDKGWEEQPESKLVSGYIYIMDSIKNKLPLLTGLTEEHKSNLNRLYDEARSNLLSKQKKSKRSDFVSKISFIATFLFLGIIFIAATVFLGRLDFPFKGFARFFIGLCGGVFALMALLGLAT